MLPALRWCLHLLVAGLLALPVARAAAGEVARPLAVWVTAGAVGFVYAVGPVLTRVGRRRRMSAVWLAVLTAGWLALLYLSPDGVWLAFPLYFLHLHLLTRRWGAAALTGTALAAVAGYAWHQGELTAAMFLGPVLGAAVAAATVLGYQALYRESERRRRLVEQLSAARADLSAAHRIAGMTAERERLAREIHDTLAQGLTSIQLLLRAAGRALEEQRDGGDASAAAAARYVEQARQAAQDNLAEARHFVHELAPPDLDGKGASLTGALDRLCATTSARHGLAVRFHESGDRLPLPPGHETALLRIAQSALANTVSHADAAHAEVTLTHLGDQVALDVVDDGAGFVPAAGGPPASQRGRTSGYGLRGMRARAGALGGTLTVESAPGRGTAIAVQLPVERGHAAGRSAT